MERKKSFNIFQKIRYNNSKVKNCNKCDLISECTEPVISSKGLYNIAIIGEAPGKDEDKEGEGFVGRAGTDILWSEIKKYGLDRIKFHITNVCKCYPKKTGTPKKEHIKECMVWLEEELDKIRCRLALVFGNTGVRAFTGADGGIMKLNGKTEWNEQYKLWISWCVHPAAVLHNSDNRKDFEIGIKNFIETIKSLDGVDEILF